MEVRFNVKEKDLSASSENEDACEFCQREKGTEPIYDDLQKREIWICAACDSKIEWQPCASTSFMLTGVRKAGLGPAAGNPTQGTSLRGPVLPLRTVKGGLDKDD